MRVFNGPRLRKNKLIWKILPRVVKMTVFEEFPYLDLMKPAYSKQSNDDADEVPN